MTDQTGLTEQEAEERRKRFGKNEITARQGRRLLKQIKYLCSEPIYLLLAGSAILYFLLGETADGIIMIFFVVFVIGINLFQDIRTGNALKKLKAVTEPRAEVIRGGQKCLIPREELVPGDLVLLYEGVKIPADGYLVHCAGLTVNESLLTGESSPVRKEVPQGGANELSEKTSRIRCYAGTCVMLGTGRMIVEQTGNSTEYGRLAQELAYGNQERSLLQRQLRTLARQCSYFAAVMFFLVGGITFWNLAQYPPAQRLIHSILAGAVLALSLVPGEFPVILSVYFSLGALRLARRKALVRRLSAIESLGAVSVLCLDKTGTITQNSLSVSEAYVADKVSSAGSEHADNNTAVSGYRGNQFCKVLALACKKDSRDPVEHALLSYGEELCRCCNHGHWNKMPSASERVMACSGPEEGSRLLREYPFSNETRAMGQLWMREDRYILAAKGSPEAILARCTLTRAERHQLEQRLAQYSGQGLKVIALAEAVVEGEELPENLPKRGLHFCGLLALADPPRETIADGVAACYHAGVRILMITGDHPVTASSVAKKVGIRNFARVITGDELDQMTDEEMGEKVKSCNVYARVLPLHKVRIVKALRNQGEIVAMAGDGINDAAAQMAADIGIAMGQNGSEVTREAADIILLDDHFPTILDTIRDGRRIYQNILKTIAYVLAFHIPIALICLAAPLVGIGPEDLLLMPLHIVLLELVMNPTVSVTLERLPAESDIMKKSAGASARRLVSFGIFLKCLVQGGMIFCAAFCLHFSLLNRGYPAKEARTCGFTVLVLSSILLVLVNCSEQESIFKILGRLWRDKGICIINLGIPVMLLLLIYTPLHGRVGFAPVSITQLLISIVLSMAAVLWYEVVKAFKRLLRE